MQEVQEAYNTIHNITTINLKDLYQSKPWTLNRTVLAVFKNDKYDLKDFIARRLGWWLHPVSSDEGSRHSRVQQQQQQKQQMLTHAEATVAQLKAACKVLPPHVAAYFLKTLANAWVTSARMGGHY